ncbi:MAG: hypothetical protein HOO01_07170 [Cellvibrionales bacterium]|nr:hypothetical protein [Cellvibrionales bacterium]
MSMVTAVAKASFWLMNVGSLSDDNRVERGLRSFLSVFSGCYCLDNGT